MTDLILLSHPMFGVLGILAAVWVFVETLNASESNQARIRTAATAAAVFVVLAWILGGYWYVHFYAPEKAIILKGPWPWAHDFFMETKEHLFFIPLILALYLPIAASNRLFGNTAARSMVLVVSALIFLTGLSIEGSGAMINYGVKVGLFQTGKAGAEQ